MALSSRWFTVSISQSRCLSFQALQSFATRCNLLRFNLAIEMLVISGLVLSRARRVCGAFRFNLAIEMLVISGLTFASKCGIIYLVSISQSRCLSFQGTKPTTQLSLLSCFNLAIEMLVISGSRDSPKSVYWTMVSISQSRCLSFQVKRFLREDIELELFQSRNRDACHFRG